MEQESRAEKNRGEAAVEGDHPLQRIPGSSYASTTANSFSSVSTPNPIGNQEESFCKTSHLIRNWPLGISAWDRQIEVGELLASSSPSRNQFLQLLFFFEGRVMCFSVQVLMFKTSRTASKKQFASQKHKSPPWLTFKTKESKTSGSGITGLLIVSISLLSNWEPWMPPNESEIHTPTLVEGHEMAPKCVPHVMSLSEKWGRTWPCLRVHDACIPHDNSLFSPGMKETWSRRLYPAVGFPFRRTCDTVERGSDQDPGSSPNLRLTTLVLDPLTS